MSSGLIPLVSSALNVLNPAAKKRAETLQRDLAAAQAAVAGGNMNENDYIMYAAQHGNNVTRYEYDNLRRPLENAPANLKAASGLFPATMSIGGISPITALNSVTNPLAASVGGSNNLIMIAVAGLALLMFMKKR